MDADATERGRALEERVARLEARLRRLEEVAGVEPDPLAQAATDQRSPTSASPAPAAAALPPAAPAPGPMARPMYWQVPGRKPPPALPVSVTPEEGGPSAWGESGPSFRLPSSIRLPDLSGSLNELEARLAGRALAWIGGLALVLGAIFFLSLAFSRGWIGPELRVVMGLAAGAIALAGGAVFMDRGNHLIGHVLTPVGLAIISISLMAATRLYALIPVEIGLAGALVSAIAAAIIAIRANSQIVAAFGLVAVLVAPPIMGATPDMVTLLFVAAVLVGTTGIALWRSWAWLPPIAFVLSVPQAAAWIAGNPEPVIGLAGIALYWLLNVVAAGGEEFRRRRDDLSPSSVTLLLANAAFLIWAGFSVIGGDLVVYRGLFLILVALGQFCVGGYFVVRDGERNLFGLTAIGTGIAALTMAAPIQLGAPVVPIAWSAEAVALASVAVRRGHPYSAVVAGLLYVLAGAYLIVLYGQPLESTSGVPFIDRQGAAFGFFIASVAVGLWLVRDRSLRSGLAAFGLIVGGWCVALALDGPGAVMAITILMVVGAAVWQVMPSLPGESIAWQAQGLIPRALQAIGEWRRPTDALLPLTTALLGLSATWLLVGPLYGFTVAHPAAGVPFVDPTGLALAFYLVGMAAVAWISGLSRLREPLAAVGLLVAAWACLSELEGSVLVAAWAGLMVVGLAIWRGLAARTHRPRMILGPDGGAMLTLDLVLPYVAMLSGGFAAIHVLLIDLPIQRFGDVLPPDIPFTGDGALAVISLTVAVLGAGALVGGALARRVSILVAGGVAAYSVPFEVYAWAVSVLWVGLGGLSLLLARADRVGRPTYLIATGVVVGAAASVAVGIVAPPSRLVVGSAPISVVVLVESIASFAAIIAGLFAIARTGRGERWAHWAWIAGGVTAVYVLSIGVVGAFATQVGGSIATDELRTQGQVALSVLWAILGLSSFVVGLRGRSDDLRHGGLALLALATAKVFLFDLSALDVAYRVISLIALGLLLLSGAWLFQRLEPRSTGRSGAGDTPI